MKRILIAWPDGIYPRVNVDMNANTEAFFNSEEAFCFSSLNPEDIPKCDGLIFPGGAPDVNPKLYGESNTACGIIDDRMDSLQLAMIRRAVELRKPIFGICRGYQLVSVYFGATMIQDISSSEYHKYDEDNPKFHEIFNVKGTMFYREFGASITINSAHHQALKRLPECLRIGQLWCRDSVKAEEYLRLAEAGELHECPEGCVIEAVYNTSYPFVGLQWHPEMPGVFYCRHIDSELHKVREIFYRMMNN